MEVGDEIYRMSCVGYMFSIINYYSDDFLSYGECIEKIYLFIFFWFWLVIWCVVENFLIV